MSIEYWSDHHKGNLYNYFDSIYLNKVFILDADDLRMIINQKVTRKAIELLEEEYNKYVSERWPSNAEEQLFIHCTKKTEKTEKIEKVLFLSQSTAKKIEEEAKEKWPPLPPRRRTRRTRRTSPLINTD